MTRLYIIFFELFSSLDHRIEYYLFQLPPNAHPSTRQEIETFLAHTKLGKRFALEWRNPKWYTKDNLAWAKNLCITVVSADCPQLPADIFCSSDTVYLRLHGRSDWFEHHYSRKELGRMVEKVVDTGCKRFFAFFNNDSSQLKNARALMGLLQEKLQQ